ncbi:hypothetical protein [Amphibacillus xylanus]|uniref:Uncharacterized protein n=1 Tax=Amphibacillus xylanus (strain ATCC 51415 / DSM 6626 / JCM 7361 / LMG 17667 / NBRC 15112 / Ep01) TaxID=698758 RepID=K0J6H7_AMPXN|nr:hypothetical protein [Amphibacillus xylanus]BAM46658.1 hypothetical protein AXY_05260 [Amphibacillus xylanus NBRC 15112]
MDPVIDQLFKIDQIAKNMESEIDDQKEKLRQLYRNKQQEFDQESNRQTEEQLRQIQNESKQLQEEMSKKVYEQHKAERDRLEHVYRKKQDQIVNHIFENIIKG